MRHFRLNGRVYVAGLLAASVLWISLRLEHDHPNYEGKRLSAWYDQLFSKEINSNNVPISCAAEGVFLRMKGDAVPFLVRKLKYHPIGDELLVCLVTPQLRAYRDPVNDTRTINLWVASYPECSYGAVRVTLILRGGRTIRDVIIGGDAICKIGQKLIRSESDLDFSVSDNEDVQRG
jgi:hypothetical protein